MNVKRLYARHYREIREAIDAYSADRSTTPRALTRDQKRELVGQLHRDGYFDSRSSAQAIADQIGVSRATVYNYAK